MKILLGGIPLGCDNIGDEAIIASVAGMLKESIPGAAITVATADASTAKRLDVDTVPPYGFAGCALDGFSATVKRHDAYVWCGATGLSDYPSTALDLLETAQKSGVATFIWGVGMDDELNPVFFKAAGKRRALLSCLGLTGAYERYLRAKLARRISKILPECRGVWLRDPQSAAMLAKTGFPGAKIAADTAILLAPPRTALAEPASGGDKPRTLGLCISTQRQVSDLQGLKRMLDKIRSACVRVTGIPMNPKTDRRLMESMGVECIAGDTPEDVMAAAAQCDAVLSSRLHLLILAANAGTRGIGIARGSKLANWLSNFGENVAGSVYDCDWDVTGRIVLDAISGRGGWEAKRAAAYKKLYSRLDAARKEFVSELEKTARSCGADKTQ